MPGQGINSMENLIIKQCSDEKEITEALSLAWRVFLEYEASDRAPEEMEKFRESIYDGSFLDALTIYAAYQKDKMAGMIATCNSGSHIALFYVDGNFHRQGIGRELFEEAGKHNTAGFMTVNSSLYAIPVYHKLGFADMDTVQNAGRMKFMPMKMEKYPKDGHER